VNVVCHVITNEIGIIRNGPSKNLAFLFKSGYCHLQHVQYTHNSAVKMEFDYQLKTPFSMVISGMPKSGKSTLTKNILFQKEMLLDKAPRNVIWCYTEPQPALFQELQSKIPEIQFHAGLPSEYEPNSIIILDDLMDEAGKSSEALTAFTRKCHHSNICLLILVQNFFHKNLRGITTCCHYICLFNNPRDSSTVSHLGRQLNRGKKHAALEQAYDECGAHGHVFIDCSQGQRDGMRVRSSIFPEFSTIYSCKQL